MLVFEILFWTFLIYITITHLLATVLTWRGFRKYKDEIVNENPTDSVTIVSPAYNEERSIISSVKSLLNQSYENLDVIVVNDGSEDDTFNLLQKYFDLVEIPISDSSFEKAEYTSEVVNSIWESKDEKLTVINKVNGSKFDALNCGTLYSRSSYIVSVDADTYLNEEAVKEMMMRKRDDVSAVSVAIGILNESEIENHKLVNLKIPNKFIVISQMLEYMRNFVTLRTSTDDLNGVMVISGACGMYERKMLIEIGGYKNSIVEDANLTLRIQESGGKIQFLSRILAYTEAPETIKELHCQRMRWIRGMLSEVFSHRHLIRTKTFLGRFMIPYTLFTDFLGVWIELLALGLFVVSLWLGLINWSIFLIVLIYVFTLYFISLFSLYYVSYKKLDGISEYDGKFKASLVGVLEFAYFRPLLAFFVIKSQFLELFKFKKNWGKLKRRGF